MNGKTARKLRQAARRAARAELAGGVIARVVGRKWWARPVIIRAWLAPASWVIAIAIMLGWRAAGEWWQRALSSLTARSQRLERLHRRTT